MQTTWFDRHGSTPITELPADWPAEYRDLVERRIALIESSKEIGLIEKPEYKCRWNTESWDDQQQRALRNWLPDRLEGYFSSNQGNEPRLTSIAKLADIASADADLLLVAAIYRDREDFDCGQLIAELVGAESVPFLTSLRYKPAELRKREVWEWVWELQREEDGHLSLVHRRLLRRPQERRLVRRTSDATARGSRSIAAMDSPMTSRN